MGRSMTHCFQCTVGIGYCTASIIMAIVVSLILSLFISKFFCGVLRNGFSGENLGLKNHRKETYK